MADVFKLVSLTSLKDYLGLDQSDTSRDAVLTMLRNSTENLLELQTNQQFGPSAELVETRDGTGYKEIWTFRPISSVVSIEIKMGLAETPSFWLPLNIVTDLRYRPGHRRIASIFYNFPEGRDNIVIDYIAQSNQPAIGVHAILEATAIGFNRIGSEETRSEQLGTYQRFMTKTLDESLFWKQAVENLYAFPIG